jgi:hypothetical protein
MTRNYTASSFESSMMMAGSSIGKTRSRRLLTIRFQTAASVTAQLGDECCQTGEGAWVQKSGKGRST